MIGASYHRQATQLRCSDDLFDTIIVVSPQGYVEDSASADASSKSIATYVHRIINIRLLWRWHRTFYSIYMYSRHGYLLLGNLDPSIHPSIHKICIKISSFAIHPREHYLHPNCPTTYWTTPDDRHNNKHDICAALAYWCTSVVDQYQ